MSISGFFFNWFAEKNRYFHHSFFFHFSPTKLFFFSSFFLFLSLSFSLSLFLYSIPCYSWMVKRWNEDVDMMWILWSPKKEKTKSSFRQVALTAYSFLQKMLKGQTKKHGARPVSTTAICRLPKAVCSKPLFPLRELTF